MEGVLDILNTGAPGLGTTSLYEGAEGAVILSKAPELLVFLRNIPRPANDSPVSTATTSQLPRIRWIVVNRFGKGLGNSETLISESKSR
jgi:hypothetical protein